jgi:hypothetical protein
MRPLSRSSLTPPASTDREGEVRQSPASPSCRFPSALMLVTFDSELQESLVFPERVYLARVLDEMEPADVQGCSECRIDLN